MNNPKLILADEPTGALDTKTSEAIMEQFTMLNKEGTTIIVVTHEHEVAQFAKRTIVVRDGEILQEDLGRGAHYEFDGKFSDGVFLHSCP